MKKDERRPKKPPGGKAKRKRGYEGRRIDTYRAWKNMLARCLNPTHHGYATYGGRGIGVHTGWIPVEGDRESSKKAFMQFCHDVGIRPNANVSLDRIRVDGHYEPGNVRWATKLVQSTNKRSTVFVIHPKTGLQIAAALLAVELGMSYNALRYKMKKEGKWIAIPQPVIEEEED